MRTRRDMYKSEIEKMRKEIDELVLEFYEEKQKRIKAYGIAATYPYQPRNIWKYLKKEKSGLTAWAVRCALERLVEKGKLVKEKLSTKTRYRLKTSA